MLLMDKLKESQSDKPMLLKTEPLCQESENILCHCLLVHLRCIADSSERLVSNIIHVGGRKKRGQFCVYKPRCTYNSYSSFNINWKNKQTKTQRHANLWYTNAPQLGQPTVCVTPNLHLYHFTSVCYPWELFKYMYYILLNTWTTDVDFLSPLLEHNAARNRYCPHLISLYLPCGIVLVLICTTVNCIAKISSNPYILNPRNISFPLSSFFPCSPSFFQFLFFSLYFFVSFSLLLFYFLPVC